jgi:hypothetical protein
MPKRLKTKMVEELQMHADVESHDVGDALLGMSHVAGRSVSKVELGHIRHVKLESEKLPRLSLRDQPVDMPLVETSGVDRRVPLLRQQE